MRKGLRWAAVATCAVVVVGCLEGSSKVMLTYILPAQYEGKIPAGVKQVAVVKFTALQRTDETYGEVCAAKLNERLIESGRYTIYDRRHLDKIIEEQDFRESGLALGNKIRTKLTSVDAIITGSVDAGSQVLSEEKSEYDLAQKKWVKKTVQYLIAQATLTFQMLEVNTGRVVASVGEVADFDSRKQSGGFLSGLMGGGGGLPPPDTKLKELITECVDRFIRKIAPHPVNFPVKLENGKSDFVKTGNKFAKTGQWKEAEGYYRQAIQADVKNEDDGARFNLGVALEAQARFAEAVDAYQKAVNMSPDSKYVDSLARVKRYGKTP